MAGLLGRDLSALNAEADLNILGTGRLQAARQLVALDPGLSGILGQRAAQYIVNSDPIPSERLGIAVRLYRVHLLGATRARKLIEAALTRAATPTSAALTLDRMLPLSSRVHIANHLAASKTSARGLEARVQLVLTMARQHLSTQSLDYGTTTEVLQSPSAHIVNAVMQLVSELSAHQKLEVANRMDSSSVIQAFGGNAIQVLQMALGIARTPSVLNDLAVDINDPTKSLPLFKEAHSDDPGDPIIAANWAATSAIVDMDSNNTTNFDMYTPLLESGLKAATGPNNYQAVLDDMTVFQDEAASAAYGSFGMAGCDDLG
jgi:hypothetical protein